MAEHDQAVDLEEAEEGRAELKRPDLKGQFQCSICKKVFCHSSSLSRHRMQAHLKAYTCTLCNKVESSESIRAHMSRVHKLSRDFRCRCCNFAFADKAALRAHVQQERLQRSEHMSRRRVPSGRDVAPMAGPINLPMTAPMAPPPPPATALNLLESIPLQSLWRSLILEGNGVSLGTAPPVDGQKQVAASTTPRQLQGEDSMEEEEEINVVEDPPIGKLERGSLHLLDNNSGGRSVAHTSTTSTTTVIMGAGGGSPLSQHTNTNSSSTSSNATVSPAGSISVSAPGSANPLHHPQDYPCEQCSFLRSRLLQVCARCNYYQFYAVGLQGEMLAQSAKAECALKAERELEQVKSESVVLRLKLMQCRERALLLAAQQQSFGTEREMTGQAGAAYYSRFVSEVLALTSTI